MEYCDLITARDETPVTGAPLFGGGFQMKRPPNAKPADTLTRMIQLLANANGLPFEISVAGFDTGDCW